MSRADSHVAMQGIRVRRHVVRPAGAVGEAGWQRGADHGGVRAAVRIDDSPAGRRRTILVVGDDLDAYTPVASMREVEVAASLWGIGLAQVDLTEVGDLPER